MGTHTDAAEGRGATDHGIAMLYYERVLCETAAWLSGSKLVDGGITVGHIVVDDAVLTKQGRHVAEPSTVKLNSIVAGGSASVR